MIRCNLSTLMDRKKAGLKISDVSNATGINRSTLTLLFYNKAIQLDLMVLEILCCYFDCPLTDLIQHQSDKTLEELKKQWDQDKTSRKELAKIKSRQRKSSENLKSVKSESENKATSEDEKTKQRNIPNSDKQNNTHDLEAKVSGDGWNHMKLSNVHNGL